MSSEIPSGDGAPDRNRVYYLVASPEREVDSAGSLEIAQLLGVLWRRKAFVLAITILVAAGCYLSSFLMEPRYTSEAVMTPSEEKTGASVLGQLGGLASLAGISVGGAKTQEPLSILKSRDFARRFIEGHKLLPLLFRDKWDSSRGAWRDSSDAPDIRDAVRQFHRSVLSVAEDKKTGLVTVRITWFDAAQSAVLANDMVRELNEDLRQRAVREAERNIAYLKAESTSAQVLPLQQSIGRLLEAEMQKHMLAKGNEEFAFKVVDTAVAPKRPAWPRPLLLAFLGALGGFAIAAVWALGRHWLGSRPA